MGRGEKIECNFPSQSCGNDAHNNASKMVTKEGVVIHT